MKHNSPLSKIILIFFCFILFDRLFWGELYWKIPNESSWGTDFFYNYNYEKKRLEQDSNHKDRILIIGSSIARYSFETSLLEDYLKTKGFEREVRLLSHAGMTPIDAYGQRDSIEKMKEVLFAYSILIPIIEDIHGEKYNEIIDDEDFLQEFKKSRYT